MTEKEKNEINSTEKKTERIFVLGIGRGPKMRTLEFIFTPVEKAEEEKAPQEEDANKKAEEETE